MNREIIAGDLRRLTRGTVTISESLAIHTTFGVGGPADILVSPDDVDEAVRILEWIGERSIPLYLLGRGSNLLVDDRGVRGIVVKMGPGISRIRHRTTEDGTSIEVEAGAPLSALLGYCLRYGLTGMERMAGIPASVGGAVAMNAGVNDYSMATSARAILAFDRVTRRARWIGPEDCTFGYRESIFLEPGGPVVLAAEFGTVEGDPKKISEVMRASIARRETRHPWRQPSAGSVFRNPPGMSAGRIIERAGLKGTRVGGAVVSPVHANFIVNEGGASCSDIEALIDRIRSVVEDRFGIALELELRVWKSRD